MTDQCKNCTYRGDIDNCLLTDCSHHENWISFQHKERYEALLAQVAEMAHAYKQRLITMTNEEVDAAFSKYQPTEELCEHGNGVNDYCEPCGRIHNE